jgi:alkylhydroperoxidase/carboxymuconolactone decarboxylase family protein YurZ
LSDAVADETIEPDDWQAEWIRMTGRVSETAAGLHEMNPTAEESYRRLRSWIYAERADGLSRKHKELVMIVMNQAVGNKEGALTHLKHGLNNGLTTTEVREALSLTFLFLGVTGYLQVGHALWKACAEHEAANPGA